RHRTRLGPWVRRRSGHRRSGRSHRARDHLPADVGTRGWRLGRACRDRSAILNTSVVTIEPMRDEHGGAVLPLYQYRIDEGNATFETAAPSWDAFIAAHSDQHRYVAVDARGTVVGWAACTPVSDRCVYAGVVEHSVYVHPDHRGRQIGRRLLERLI